MALVKSGTIGSGPAMRYELHATETGGSGNNRTIKVQIKAKVDSSSSSSWYGYPLTRKITINGVASPTTQIKGSERWDGGDGWRTFEYTNTVNVGTTSSKNITVRVDFASSGGNWDGSGSGSFGVSQTVVPNKAPTWSSGAVLKTQENNSSGRVLSSSETGTENAMKVSEALERVYISWSAASDDKGISRYVVRAQKNDGNWYDIYSGTSRNYTHNIGVGSATQGDKWDYYVYGLDASGEKTPNLDSVQFQKNILTAASFSTRPSKITYSGSDVTHNLAWGGASNTYTSVSITKYELSSTGVTLHNGNAGTSTSKTLIIWNGSGSAPTGPYIRRSDLQSFVANSADKTGTITLKLKTTNSAGSAKETSVSVAVDMKATPSAPGSISIGNRATVAGGNHIIPTLNQPKAVWTAGSDPLGGAVTYRVEVAIGGGSYSVVGETSGLELGLSLGAVSAATQLKVRVSTRTSYGTTNSREITDTINYWNPPTITFGKPSRTGSDFSIPVTVAKNTSLSSVSINLRKYIGRAGQEITFTTDSYTIRETGLTDTDSYAITVIARDNSGLGNATTTQVTRVSAVKPVLSVREKGVGVGFIPDGSAALKVNGTVHPVHTNEANPTYLDGGNGLSIRMANGSGDGAVKGLPADYTTGLTIRSNENRQFEIAGDNMGGTLFYRAGHVNNTGGTNTGWSKWRKVMGVAEGQYDGLMSGGGDQNWLRTTKNGIIPYQQGTNGSIGSSSWNFDTGYISRLYQRGPGGLMAKVGVNPTAGREELQIYVGGDAYSTGSKGAGIHLYGNNDAEHDGNIAFLTGPSDKGTARMIISERGNITIGGAIWDHVDSKLDKGLVNIVNPVSQPAIYINGTSSSEGEIAYPTGEFFDIGEYNGSTFKSTLKIKANDIIINGYFEAGGEGSGARFGTDGSDVYVSSRNAKWLRLKTDGSATYGGKNVLLNQGRQNLWSGAAYPVASATITPSKSLSDCQNGWCLVWSDYNEDTSSAGNTQWFYYYIHKNTWQAGTNFISVPHYTGEGKNIVKEILSLTNTSFKGSDNNHSNAVQKDVVLRFVCEW